MTILQGLVLGAVQGATEWLPVSSEGINTLIQVHFFQRPLGEAIAISLWLHLGTLIAAVVYFRRDIMSLVRHLPRYAGELRSGTPTEPGALISFLAVSTLLSGALGAPLLLVGLDQQDIPTGLVMAAIGVLLIITGLVQKFAPRLSAARSRTGTKDAILLGVVQAFSVLPGLSRSGLTVSALLFRGYEARQAVRFSFLMGIPVVLAAGVGLNIVGGASFDAPSVAGLAAAFLLGMLTIGALLRVAARVRFWAFCLFLGGLSLLPLLIERL